MDVKKQSILISSIFEGEATYSDFPSEGQFTESIGIDPEDDGNINPVDAPRFVNSVMPNTPLWISKEPKTGTTYIYDIMGSVYTANGNTISGLGDLNDGGTASGNGMAYYDNYMYFARDTTIARYGPLDGTPTWTDDYWVTGVPMTTALVNTSYPTEATSGIEYPNHFLKTGKDGRLYIADVVDNQGTIHYIQTTKTTVEGDTNNGSTYNAVDLPYGYWPIAMENLNEELVIACSDGLNNGNIKIVFWDTSNTDTYTRVVDFEFSDKKVCGLKNINGVLYLLTHFNDRNTSSYVRVSRYIGGYSFEQYALKRGVAPLSGAIGGYLNRLLFGGGSNDSETPYAFGGGLNAIGLLKEPNSNGVFTIRNSTYTSSSECYVTAVCTDANTILTGWSVASPSSVAEAGIDGSDSNLPDNPSPLKGIILPKVKVGTQFKVTKIAFGIKNTPIAYPFKVGIWSEQSTIQDVGTGTRIQEQSLDSSTPLLNDRYVFRPTNFTGGDWFSVYFYWPQTLTTESGTPIRLPIYIEYETYDE